MTLREQLQESLAGAYIIERELGGGGMSRVFVAEEVRLRRKVVIKVLASEVMEGLSAERFEREIRMAASLQQANIVPVLNTGDTGGVPFYTMPYVEGESLRSRLKERALSVGEAVSVLRDVARALGYAHDRGIVHRDIKPDNVLLSGGTAVVTDFGIAKAIAASRTYSGAEATITQIGMSIGTPAYIAPEQAAGDPEIDHRADIYSFGCMAYELLAGRPPFLAKTPQRLMAAHMGETPQPINELRAELSPALASFVMRCLAKEADKRPQSAVELLASLDGVTTSDAERAALPPVLLGGRRMLGKSLAIYAVSVLAVWILAKAAIVGIGLPSWVLPGALGVMALGLPAILFTAYTQHVARRALTATPTFTPGGSARPLPQGTIATMALKAAPRMSFRRTARAGVWTLGAFAVAVSVFMVLRALGIGPAGSLFARGTLAEHERIIVCDFSASTADTSLGPVVSEAFRASLAQSQSLELIPTTSLREMLRLMQRPTSARIDYALAREIATREGIKAVIDGQIIGVGGSYTLTAKLVTASSGDALVTVTERANSEAEILSAIDRLSKTMRERVGESLRSVQSTPSLERVTTPSLEALKKYVQGSAALTQTGDFARGVRLLEEAIALDTSFAMAYRKLGVELANAGGQTARVMELMQKAYDHQDRLTDVERYVMLGSYYVYGPKQDRAKSIAANESALELNPNDVAALNNVGNSYRALRQYAKAVDVYKRAIVVDPQRSVFYGNLIDAQTALGRLDDARETAKAYVKALPNAPGAKTAPAQLAIAEGAYDSVATIGKNEFAAAAGNSFVRARLAGALTSLALTRGEIAEAARWASEGRRALGERGGIASVRLDAALDSVYLDVWFRGAANQAPRIDAALRAHPLDSIPAAERPYGRLVALYAQAGAPAKGRALMAAWEQSRRGISQTGDSTARHVMNGELALAEKRFTDAVREFRLADVGACPVCQLPNLARAYDLAGMADSASAAFTRYIESKYWGLLGVDASYRAGAYKRLGELYEAKGDKARAATNYAKFVDLWKNADPELQPQVAEAKRRLASLSTDAVKASVTRP